MDREVFEQYLTLEERHFWRIAKRKLVAQWLDEVALTLDGRVLDIGGAASLITRDLKRFGKLTVVEPDAEMVDVASQSGDINVIKGGFPRLPEIGSFDLITLLDVLEHLDDDRAALVEIRRLLRPGGIFLLTVPAYMWLWTEHDVALHHKRRYTRSDLFQLLESVGFEVLRISYYTTFLLPVMAAQRLLWKMAVTRGGKVAEQAFYRVKVPPPLINRLLGGVMTLERRLLLRHRLPVGGAIIALCR